MALILPQRAFAWTRAGHQAAAIIAQNRLSPQAMEKVRAILGSDIGLDKIALCADDIKKASVMCGGAFYIDHRPDTAAWHFIDIPTQLSPTESSVGEHCHNRGEMGNCIVNRIREQLDILRDPKAAQAPKQLALMFLVHLVVDAHQPLHAATEIDRNGRSDRGGNAKPVWFKTPPRSKPTNLHFLWDSVIETEEDARQIDSRALARKLDQAIRDEDARSWRKGDIIPIAAVESFNTAKEKIYPAYHGHACRESGAGIRDQMPASLRKQKQDGGYCGRYLDAEYQNRMQPIAYERLQKAGVRLAFLLEQALAN